jgi:hypothetical protein
LTFGLETIGLALALYLHFFFVKEFVSNMSLGFALIGLVEVVWGMLVLACFHFLWFGLYLFF